MAFGAVFAAILAVVAAAGVHPDAADDDSAEVVDSADPGVAEPSPAAAEPISVVARAAPAATRVALAAPQAALPGGAQAAPVAPPVPAPSAAATPAPPTAMTPAPAAPAVMQPVVSQPGPVAVQPPAAAEARQSASAVAQTVAAVPPASATLAAASPAVPPAPAVLPPASPTSPPAPAPASQGTALADAGPILLDRADRTNGWALERLLEPSGEIVEHEVNRAGTVQSCRTVGTLFTLRILEQRPAAGGEVVEVVRDASGALLRFAIGLDGEPRAVSLLAPPPR